MNIETKDIVLWRSLSTKWLSSLKIFLKVKCARKMCFVLYYCLLLLWVFVWSVQCDGRTLFFCLQTDTFCARIGLFVRIGLVCLIYTIKNNNRNVKWSHGNWKRTKAMKTRNRNEQKNAECENSCCKFDLFLFDC